MQGTVCFRNAGGMALREACGWRFYRTGSKTKIATIRAKFVSSSSLAGTRSKLEEFAESDARPKNCRVFPQSHSGGVLETSCLCIDVREDCFCEIEKLAELKGIEPSRV